MTVSRTFSKIWCGSLSMTSAVGTSGVALRRHELDPVRELVCRAGLRSDDNVLLDEVDVEPDPSRRPSRQSPEILGAGRHERPDDCRRADGPEAAGGDRLQAD